MAASDKTSAPAEPAEDATRAEPPAPPVPPRTIASVAPGPQRTIASYANYADAESTVDWLADQGFPVERGAIVGMGLRSVERVAGRMTARRAALVGAAWGIIAGALLALLAGIFPWDSGSAEMLAFAVVIGAVFGAVTGALVHEALSGGRRDFISATRIEADRYDVQVDADAADDATRLLAAMPSARAG
jgi:Heat induced stress protein YflT domain